MNLRE